MFYADLHVHSKYSRATSRDADLEHMAIWARKKGVSVLGTGDFTHPAWFAEIQEKLVPAEPGLFRLRDDLEREVNDRIAGACQGPMRFMLEVEISTIYKKGDRTRKVHHLIYAPDLDKAERLIQQLSRIGNLKSDGRPILGLDSRDLLEITLESGDGCYLVPAHIWTPWFAVLGSKSGFDAVEDCYGDLTPHIFALETGLSSDPPMNWRLSGLDRYQLVSNSDAHSPPKIGREACAFETELDYFAMRHALETGEGYGGTVEFFPEEGKYHMDGHRKCGVRLSPSDTRQLGGRCPECGKPLTVGVLSRVDALADRPQDFRPDQPMRYRNLVPLPEVLAEIRGVGQKSKRVQHAYEELINKVGPELLVLQEIPVEEVRTAGAPMVAEAIRRMREGRVFCEGGYDGEYGTIRLFEREEINRGDCVSMLFEMSSAPADREAAAADACVRVAGVERSEPSHPARGEKSSHEVALTDAGNRAPPDAILDGLDPDQRRAAEVPQGPLLIVAGPGTGKTRTLTHRVAHLIAHHKVPSEQCLAITFSRRAADEMSQRLKRLLPEGQRPVNAMTFHALGLTIIREHEAHLDRPRSVRVASERERREVLVDHFGASDRRARSILANVSRIKRAGSTVDSAVQDLADPKLKDTLLQYKALMRDEGLLDFDDLIALPIEILENYPDVTREYQTRWPWTFVDEFQDIDDGQYRLIRLLVPPTGNLCAIGDPDQSIYGFRGSNPRAFEQFTQDYSQGQTVHLTRNYRSSRTIVNAAMQVIQPSSLVTDRVLNALSERGQRIEIRCCPSERAEAEFVVHTTERLIGGSTFFSLDSGRVDTSEGEALSFGDFAVLYRTDAQSYSLCEAFQRSGIPFQKHSHHALADEAAVQAVIAHMNAALLCVDNTADLPAQTTVLLGQAAKELSADHPGLTDCLARLRSLAERHDASPAQFLDALALGVDGDGWDPRADRVSLLTLHAAKGLEFSVVFLVGCEEDVLPLRWSRSTEVDLAEERRLFFVGMTRARKRLYLTHAHQRLWRGKMRNLKVSPFLTQIEKTLLRLSQSVSTRKKKAPAEKQIELF